MKKHLLAFCSILITISLYSQTEYNNTSATGRAGVATTFATDYQTLGINVANLGIREIHPGKTSALGFFDFSVSAFSRGLERDILMNSIYHSGGTMTQEDKIDLAQSFSESDMYINLDFQLIGLSFHIEKVGGFAFSIRDHITYSSKFNEQMSDLLFKGKDASYFDVQTGEMSYSTSPLLISEIFGDSYFTFNWTREYNFGYGRHVYKSPELSVYLGAGGRYIQGFALVDLKTNNQGELTAVAATHPFLGIDFGSEESSEESESLLKPTGTGMGYDFGLSLEIYENLKLGLAVNNIGSITWSSNSYKANDFVIDTMSYAGLESADLVNTTGDILNDELFVTWEEAKDTTINLPSNFRIGASYTFFDKLDVGVDFVSPLSESPGNLHKSIIAFGADYRPVNWFKVSTGVVNGGNYDMNIPLGISFLLANNTWEIGFATKDFINYLRPNNPHASLSFGFLRFFMGNENELTNSEPDKGLL